MERTISVKCPACPNCQRISVLVVSEDGYRRWREGALVQQALPELDDDQRELLISGTHAHCWETIWREPVEVVTPPCPFCGRTSQVTVSESELETLHTCWQDQGVFDLRRAFPSMSEDDIELLISGTHRGCQR